MSRGSTIWWEGRSNGSSEADWRYEMLIRPGLFDREPLHEWVKRKCFFCGMPFEKHDREPCPTLESGYQLNLLIPANGHSRDYRRKCRHFKDIRCGIPA